MELEEAASRIQTMLNFYNGLGKLQEIVNLARTLENLPVLEKERLAAAEKAKKKMEDAQKALAKFEVEASQRIAEANAAYEALALSNKSKIAELDAALASKRESMQRLMSELASQQDTNVAAFNAELATLSARRDAALAATETAEKALASLRKKFESL